MTRVPGEVPLWVDANPVRGDITLVLRAGEAGEVELPAMSAQESANLRALLERAEQVVSTGIGAASRYRAASRTRS